MKHQIILEEQDLIELAVEKLKREGFQVVGKLPSLLAGESLTFTVEKITLPDYVDEIKLQMTEFGLKALGATTQEEERPGHGGRRKKLALTPEEKEARRKEQWREAARRRAEKLKAETEAASQPATPAPESKPDQVLQQEVVAASVVPFYGQ